MQHDDKSLIGDWIAAAGKGGLVVPEGVDKWAPAVGMAGPTLGGSGGI